MAAVPFLNDAGRALYQRFLHAPEPRAFAIAPTGSASLGSSGYDPVAFALNRCNRTVSTPQCQLYAVNNDVVWSGPAGEPVRSVGKTVRANVSTSLGAFFEVNRDCSSRGLPKIEIAAAPSHGAAIVAPRDEHPAFSPDNPLAACNAAAVPAVGVTYTPAPGYAGVDTLIINETTLDGRHHVIRIELKVL